MILLYPRKRGHSLWPLLCVPLSHPLPSGNTHIPSEGWAFRSSTHPTALDHRLVRVYDDVQAPCDEIPTARYSFLPFINLTLANESPLPHIEMNSDSLSLLNYVSGTDVFVTATSLLPNGKSEVLEVYIFNRERMGILVSFYTSR